MSFIHEPIDLFLIDDQSQILTEIFGDQFVTIENKLHRQDGLDLGDNIFVGNNVSILMKGVRAGITASLSGLLLVVPGAPGLTNPIQQLSRGSGLFVLSHHKCPRLLSCSVFFKSSVFTSSSSA